MVEILSIMTIASCIGCFIFWNIARDANRYCKYVLDEWEHSVTRLLDIHDRVRASDRETIRQLRQQLEEKERACR